MANVRVLRDRGVVVTGAAGGLSTALAERYAAAGARLALIDLDGARADALAGIDVLVNNAGISARALLRDATPQVPRRVRAVNYFGALQATRAARGPRQAPLRSARRAATWPSPARSPRASSTRPGAANGRACRGARHGLGGGSAASRRRCTSA
jgi:NAD(P)-dependent dehydrogenase (short-subunit alcohol dehydrogenase family)